MAPLSACPLLIEEPIRLASVLEQTHDPRPRVSLTKIIGTVGGNSRSPEILAELMHAGMTAARFDFSSGDVESHLETLGNLKQAMHSTGKHCAVILDTAGPEVTIGNPSGQPLEIREGSTVTLRSSGGSTSPAATDAAQPQLCLSVPGLAQAVSVGGEIFVGQYLFTGSEATSVWLRIKEVQGDDIVCEARNTGTLRGSFFTVHVSQVHIPLPTLRESDCTQLSAWLGRGMPCDILSLSFTRGPHCVRQARELLKAKGAEQVHVFAKIENLEGLTNFEGILAEADGVILGRGDLGIDLQPEKVFLFQKEVIQRCNLAGKPVVVSRVVDTMTDTPRPTRAEATDVANAVLDGVDAIMLGAETLRGLYPVEAVATVAKICGEAEKVFNQASHFRMVTDTVPEPMSELESICSSAVTTAEHVRASCIIAFTVYGKTARLIAKYRPTMPVLLLVVPNVSTNQLSWSYTGEIQARQSLVLRGVHPVLAEAPHLVGHSASNESLLRGAVEKGKAFNMISSRDRVVIVQRLKSSWVVRVVDA